MDLRGLFLRKREREARESRKGDGTERNKGSERDRRRGKGKRMGDLPPTIFDIKVALGRGMEGRGEGKRSGKGEREGLAPKRTAWFRQ